ncbi:MAG: 4-(cytidine 5'-diphospho)-2-C-methyl-D-erythritol kinase [Chloroflexota bacterium]
MRIQARAKVNLSLEVIGRRPNGYHELVSVMQTVELADELELHQASSVFFTCSEPELEANNLVSRASDLFLGRFSGSLGVNMHLEKRIPVGAGLGGGSSDAAAALSGLRSFWKVPASCLDLLGMAERLGSDVPFFLYGGTALVQGRGEQVTPLPRLPTSWILVANPRIHVSTADVFRALSSSDWTDGIHTLGLAKNLQRGVATDSGINGLQETLFRLHPDARACYEAMQAATDGKAMVSGSGPSVYALFSSEAAATEAQSTLHPTYWSCVTRTWAPEPAESPCP